MARGLREYDLAQLSAYDLIDLLDELFPRINPIPGTDTIEYIWHKAGERNLIETLTKKKEREQNG